ncbi:M96 mating-specific protein family [Phytophthora palmivora]|uniref:Transmembrane 9 superfamily member n=1 Tax=Phytophthora palmivora TaxID=4796 RepID=A0A2P4XJN2_9STRA|nr:M96 mating-specific protein family [Phytophthora palmivora]
MLLVFIILTIVTLCVTIVCTYFLLNAENYRWHWTSFAAAGSTALYVFIYAIYFYFFKTNMSGFLQTCFYFGYMGLFCFAFFIMCGTVGYLGSSIFTKRIYRNIKLLALLDAVPSASSNLQYDQFVSSTETWEPALQWGILNDDNMELDYVNANKPVASTESQSKKRKKSSNPNRARDERRLQLIELNDEVAELQFTLIQLETIRNQRPKRNGDKSQPPPQDQVPPVWQEICSRQLGRRLEVERENFRLKKQHVPMTHSAMFDGGNGTERKFYDRRIIPFDMRATGDAWWENWQSFRGQGLRDADTEADEIVERYGLEMVDFKTNTSATAFGQQITQRHVESDRIVFVFHAYVEPFGYGNDRVDGVYILEQAYVLVQPENLPSSNKNNRFLTCISSCYVATPHYLDPKLKEDGKTAALINFLVSAMSTKMLGFSEMVENLLLDLVQPIAIGL